MSVAHVCFLLHMHQPQYVDPRTGRAELPWVRLHGARAYLDVARVLEDYPSVHLTVNFVPSLVAQLEGVVNRTDAPDTWLEVSQKPIRELTVDDREFLVLKMFSLNWGRQVDPRPRYRELLDKRGRELRAEDLRATSARFTDGELRDLTVLFNLGWMGFAARENDRELEALERKGRDFTDEDLRLVLDRQHAACARVLPAWRKLAERGQVELSSSPYYHPIVPLVVDTQTARRAQPDLPLPERFSWLEDAKLQIERGVTAHRSWFGQAPEGMWPPEGSVSPEAVAAYEAAGIHWLATDEGNLWRSLQLAGRTHPQRHELYRAYRHHGVDLVFRDREISDRIGFAYAHGDSQAGAADLLERARECARLSAGHTDGPPLVPIFLDGENPWESYPGSGEPFLRALCDGLSHAIDLRALSIGEHLRSSPARTELPALHSGSWIDSDFHIWIGDPIKNRAWTLLGRVRAQLERAQGSGVSSDRLARAREHLLAAEGSDWFWWFGEPFHTPEDAIFDRLFRAHLMGALAALGEPIPDELEQPVAPTAPDTGVSPALQAPYAFIRPRIGEAGHDTSFYEWHGAGRYDVPRGAAMADNPLVERIYFGFNREHLFLRVDPSPLAELAGALLEVELADGERRLRVRAQIGAPGWTLAESNPDGSWRELGPGGPAASHLPLHAGIQLGVAFARLSLAPGTRVGMTFRLLRGEVALARYPVDGALPLTVPDDAFEAENWTA